MKLMRTGKPCFFALRPSVAAPTWRVCRSRTTSPVTITRNARALVASGIMPNA